MGNYRLELLQWRVVFWLTLFLFPFALAIYAFSGADLRQRSAKQGCRKGSPKDCLEVGKFYEQRTDGLFAFLLSNPNTAKTYYDLGCKLADRSCCARFGYMTVIGSYDSASDSSFGRAEGIAALEKACDGSDLDSCRELVDAVEPERGVQLLAKLCDGADKDSCNKLLTTLLADQGSQYDPKRGMQLLEKLCDGGAEDRCVELGDSFVSGNHVEVDAAHGVAVLGKSCERGNWAACEDLGGEYADGTHVAADTARAIELLKTACDHRRDDACFDLGKVLLASDAPRAVQVFTAECERDVRGCDALGDLYRVGTTGIARDRKHAWSLYDQACRAGDDYDCFKRDCMGGNNEHCYKMRKQQKERRYKLGGDFDL